MAEFRSSITDDDLGERSDDMEQGESPEQELTNAFAIHEQPKQLPLWGMRVIPVPEYPIKSQR